MRALRTAATGMAAQQLNVEVISNNIANMNTVGFKRQRAEFQDLLYQNVERMGDHATTIAEQVIYLVTGALPEEMRPKADSVTTIGIEGK